MLQKLIAALTTVEPPLVLEKENETKLKQFRSKASATARIQVTLDIDAQSTWSPDCSIDQIHRQAGEETLKALYRALRDSGLRYRVIPPAKVVFVSTTPEVGK